MMQLCEQTFLSCQRFYQLKLEIHTKRKPGSAALCCHVFRSAGVEERSAVDDFSDISSEEETWQLVFTIYLHNRVKACHYHWQLLLFWGSLLSVIYILLTVD